MEPCKILNDTIDPKRFAMHEKINVIRRGIRDLTHDCAKVWTPLMELYVLANHRTRLRIVKARKDAKPWSNSKGFDDLYVDADNYFRPIKEPLYHDVLPRPDPIRLPFYTRRRQS